MPPGIRPSHKPVIPNRTLDTRKAHEAAVAALQRHMLEAAKREARMLQMLENLAAFKRDVFGGK
jgi:hypothetical protein